MSQAKPPKHPNPNQGMRLNVELGSQLLFQFDDLEERFKSILVGLEAQAYLIVRVPAIAKFQDQLQVGKQFMVRYLSLGNAYGFRTTIIGSIEKPFRLIFLSYPETVESLDLRADSRVSCYIPATANLKKTQLKGVISNINSRGCRFNIKVPSILKPQQIQVISDIRLYFPVLGMEGTMEFQGKVCHTSHDRERIAFGIEFEELDAEVSEKIDAYVKNMLEYEGSQIL
jgi:c-di-GMP-binding flagellar brake protein YcgR